MGRKGTTVDGVKTHRRTGNDKAKRNFELHGTYTAKHLRVRAAEAAAAARPPAVAAQEKQEKKPKKR